MNIVRRIVVGIAGVVVIALAMELAAPKAARAVANLLVTVTNTPNVNVVNTPSVNANITNTPTVSVSSLPAVQVGSISGNVPVANPLDTDSNAIPLVTQNPVSGGNAFDVTSSCSFGSGGTIDGNECVVNPAYNVPTGKIAVIQSVTGECELIPSSNLDLVQIQYTQPTAGSAGGAFVTPGPTESGFGGAFGSFGGRVTLYAVGGSPIKEYVLASDLSEESSGYDCFIEIAGYLVNR